MNKFLENLKSELEYQGLTQKELARLCDLSVNTIHSWFTKDIFPPINSAYKISQVLKQPLEYFINGDIFPPNNYNLPTREIELLSFYRKLSDKEKKTIDLAAKTLASDYKEPESDIF